VDKKQAEFDLIDKKMEVNRAYPYFKVEAKEFFAKTEELKKVKKLWSEPLKFVGDFAYGYAFDEVGFKRVTISMLLSYSRICLFSWYIVFVESTQIKLMIFMYVNMAYCMYTLSYA